MKLSVTDIAFEGFRVVRDRPLALVAWAVLQFLGLLAFQPGVVMARDGYARLSKLSFLPVGGALPATAPTVTPAQAELAISVMGWMFQGFGLAVLATVLVSALTDPGVFRVAMTPRDRGLFSLKLGAQELRQFGLLLILYALFFGIYLTGSLASLLFQGVFAVGGPVASLMGVAIAFTATLCVLVYFSIRLSLAGPLTFEQGRIDVFGSWNLTRGRFYGLLGGYALTLAMAVLVGVMCEFIIGAGLTLVIGDPKNMKSAFDAANPEIADLFTPGAILREAFSAIAGALTTAIFVGARVQAFMQIRKGGGA
ncbi:MAG TPA: hypothetical protein VG407_12370 [Caulobacteraceae bacterium]|jgi:hypothetical protein|nr:hypothetical protein [Caulobacteraceae bacterium]